MARYIIPNDPAAPAGGAAYGVQAQPDAQDFSILAAGFQGTGITTGCAVTQRGAGANMSVDVSAGGILVQDDPGLNVGGNLAIGAAHATLGRFDLIVGDNAGVVTVLAGTAHATPVFPTITADGSGFLTRAVLAAVYVPPAVTSILDSYIVDKRVPVRRLARLEGFAAGQIIQGGTAASEDLTLESTSNATKGTIFLLDDTTISGTTVMSSGATVAGTFGSVGLISATGGLTSAGPLSLTSQLKTITADSDTIPITTSIVRLNNSSGGLRTLSSTPTIAAGIDGQLLFIYVSSANGVALQDQGTLASSNLRLSATAVTIGPRDVMGLHYSSNVGDWLQLSFQAVI